MTHTPTEAWLKEATAAAEKASNVERLGEVSKITGEPIYVSDSLTALEQRPMRMKYFLAGVRWREENPKQFEVPPAIAPGEKIPDATRLFEPASADLEERAAIADRLIELDENHPAITLPEWAKQRKALLATRLAKALSEREAIKGKLREIDGILSDIQRNGGVPGSYAKQARAILDELLEAP